MFKPIFLQNSLIKFYLMDLEHLEIKILILLLLMNFVKIGLKYGITLSSGTSALHVALLALNLKKMMRLLCHQLQCQLLLML